MKRCQRVVDMERASDHGPYSAMARRIVRAFGRRVADSDPDDLSLLLALRAELDDVTADAVRAHRRAGYSWAQIALPLGMTRQAAQQRWGAGEERAAALADELTRERFAPQGKAS